MNFVVGIKLTQIGTNMLLKVLEHWWTSIPDSEEDSWEGVSDSNINAEISKFSEWIDTLPSKYTAEELLFLIPYFKNEKDYLGLEWNFIHNLESATNYPPSQLFDIELKNNLLLELRARIFNPALRTGNEQIDFSTSEQNSNFWVCFKKLQQDLKAGQILEIPNINDLNSWSIHEINLLREVAHVLEWDEVVNSPELEKLAGVFYFEKL